MSILLGAIDMNCVTKYLWRPLIASVVILLFVATARNATAIPVTNGLQLWLDATDLDGDGVSEGLAESGLTGTTVNTWVDKSPAALTAVSSTAPVIAIGAGPNGGDVVRFDGDDRMTISGFTHGGDTTIFAVFNADVVNSNDIIFHSRGNTGAGGGAYVMDLQGNNLRGRVFNGSDNSISSTPVSAATNYLATYLHDNNATGGGRLVLDGVLMSTTNTNDTGVTTSTAIVGNHPTSSVGFDGDLSALLVYDRLLSPVDENAVGYALEQQFGLDTNYDPKSIGINFYRSIDPTFTQIAANENAGVLRADRWNNIDVDDDSSTTADSDPTFGPQALVDNIGLATGVTVRSTVDPGYAENDNGIGNATPDHKLLNAGLFMDTGNSDTGAIIIEGLDTFATMFDVYVYVEGGTANIRDFAVTINGITLTGQDRGGFDGVFTAGDGVNDGIDDDYLLFSGLTGPTLTITATNPLINGRVGIAGIQLVAVPEPASIFTGLLAFVALAGWRYRRRQQA
ncbi:MAG: LamG-like jellyroll fold domain-containing protein [Pirellulales bacterium]